MPTNCGGCGAWLNNVNHSVRSCPRCRQRAPHATSMRDGIHNWEVRLIAWLGVRGCVIMATGNLIFGFLTMWRSLPMMEASLHETLATGFWGSIAATLVFMVGALSIFFGVLLALMLAFPKKVPA